MVFKITDLNYCNQFNLYRKIAKTISQRVNKCFYNANKYAIIYSWWYSK